MGDKERKGTSREKSLEASSRSSEEFARGKAGECLAKASPNKNEISEEKEGKTADYESLGTVFFSRGEYDKAIEYFQKALALKIENWRQERRKIILQKFREFVSFC